MGGTACSACSDVDGDSANANGSPMATAGAADNGSNGNIIDPNETKFVEKEPFKMESFGVNDAITVKHISNSKHNHILLLTMNSGSKHQSVFNPTFMRVFDAALDYCSQLEGKHVLILSGTLKYFSLGMDLKYLGADFVKLNELCCEMTKIFRKLLILNMPTIAAINGHAFGAGMFIAMCCDWRIMRYSTVSQLCFPEIILKLNMGHGWRELLQNKLLPQTYRTAVLTGKKWKCYESLQAQLIDHIIRIPRNVSLVGFGGFGASSSASASASAQTKAKAKTKGRSSDSNGSNAQAQKRRRRGSSGSGSRAGSAAVAEAEAMAVAEYNQFIDGCILYVINHKLVALSENRRNYQRLKRDMFHDVLKGFDRHIRNRRRYGLRRVNMDKNANQLQSESGSDFEQRRELRAVEHQDSVSAPPESKHDS